MSSSQSHPLEKPSGLLKCACVIPSACSGIGWEQPRVGVWEGMASGQRWWWAQRGSSWVVSQLRSCSRRAEQCIFMAITKPKCPHPAPQSTTVIKEAVLQKIICVVGPERCEAKGHVDYRQVIFFLAHKYFLSFGSALAWKDTVSVLLASPAEPT